MAKSAIPVGTQFAPTLFKLRPFLTAIMRHAGNEAAIKRAFWNPPVHLKARGVPSSRRRSLLPLEAAKSYGLLTRDCKPTPIAKSLSRVRSSARLHEEFARHIMLRCGGLRVVEGAEQMKRDGLNITGDTLAHHLSSQGFRVTVHNTAINTLRLWLAQAGIFPAIGKSRMWEVDRKAKQRVLGLNDQAVAQLAGLHDDQIEFVQALCRLNPRGWTRAADVRALAEASGKRLERGSLPNRYLRPLADAGLVTFKSKGTAGGKSAVFRTTNKFDSDVLGPFVEHAVKDLDPTLTSYFNRRPKDIYRDLGSRNKNSKGQALEAFAVLVMRLLGLRFLGWRKRARDTTGRAEIDVIFAGMLGGIPSRWQVQCKNTPSATVDLEDVAKEVGLLPITNATHIVVFANCDFTRDAQDFAHEVTWRTSTSIFLLGRREFHLMKANPARLATILRDKGEEALAIQARGLWQGLRRAG